LTNQKKEPMMVLLEENYEQAHICNQVW